MGFGVYPLFGILYVILTLIIGKRIAQKFLKISGYESVAIGFLFANLCIPVLSFALAILLKTNINIYLIGAISIISILLIRTKSVMNSKIIFLPSLMFLLVLIVYLLNYQGPFLGYWDTYVAAPAITMTGQKVNFVDINNARLFEYKLQQKLPDDLVNNEAYGIISKDQRLGSGIIFSVPFLFFGMFGFRLYYALFMAFGVIVLFSLLNRLTQKKYLAAIVSLFAFLNGYVLSVNTLNPNLLGMVITIMIIFICVTNINWILLGIMFGIFGTIRNVAIIFSLPLGYLLLRERNFFKVYIPFLVTCIITLLPILYWNQYAFDNPFIHSSQYSFFEGYRPQFLHHLFGIPFEFNGLFNYPLNTEIVRTIHYAFPVFVYLLLLAMNIFGIFFIFIPYGITKFRISHQKLFLLLWLVPFYLFLSFQENWEVAKTTFILLILPILFIFLAKGLSEFTIEKTFVIGLLAVVVILAANIISSLNYTADLRWYQRFPKAAQDTFFTFDETNTHVQTPEFRFFQSRETQMELENQRRNNFILPYINWPKLNIIIWDKELSKDNIEIVNIWDYIYVPLT